MLKVRLLRYLALWLMAGALQTKIFVEMQQHNGLEVQPILPTLWSRQVHR
jgi:hypothetical protein